MNTSTIHASQISELTCTPHGPGSCVPACSGGGHCVANMSQLLSRRPSRADMLAYASERLAAENLDVSNA